MKKPYFKILELFAVAVLILSVPTACATGDDTGTSTKKDTATTTKTASEKDVQTELRNAAVAMESYYTDKTIYTVNIVDLSKFGYKPNDSVIITIPSANSSNYCIEAAARNSATMWHFDSTVGSVEQGSC